MPIEGAILFEVVVLMTFFYRVKYSEIIISQYYITFFFFFILADMYNVCCWISLYQKEHPTVGLFVRKLLPKIPSKRGGTLAPIWGVSLSGEFHFNELSSVSIFKGCYSDNGVHIDTMFHAMIDFFIS